MVSLEEIGEEIVEGIPGFVGHGWVMAEIGGHCLGMSEVVGHFVGVAVVVECWEEEEGEIEGDQKEEEVGFGEEEEVVGYLVVVGESGGVGG